MPEHSPTPWQYLPTGSSQEILDSNGQLVATAQAASFRVECDFRYIVECVNAFREPTAESQHSTPLEWLASPVTEDGNGYKILSPAGGVIAITNQQRQRIVRAVNLHDELVAFAALTMAAIKHFDTPDADALIAKGGALLAKAKGET